MRVWIVNQYAVAPSQPGGLRPYALAKELVERGHDVTLVASSFNHWTRSETRLRAGESSRFEDVDGVRFLWLRTPAYPGSTLKRLASMVAFASTVYRSPELRELPEPDVVLGSNPQLFAALAAERLASDLGTAFAFELRDIWPQSLVDFGRIHAGHPAIRILSKIESHLYRRAQALVTLLPASTEYLVSKGASRESVFWIPNGVYLPSLPPVSELPENDRFTLVFAGIHGVANGLGTVLEAARLIQAQGRAHEVLFRFVGDGGERNALKARAQELGLTNVEFLDPVPKSEVPRVIAAADAGLMILKSSPVFRWGISPNKLFDYFGAGRPVLFSVDAANNPVEDAGAGVSVAPDDPTALAEGALRLACLPREARRQMGLAGRRYVEDHHDLAKLGGELENALHYAVKRSR